MSRGVIPSTTKVDGITIDTNASGELEIKGGAVGTSLISSGAVTADKIASGAVVLDKMGSDVMSWEFLGATNLGGSSTAVNPAGMSSYDELMIIIKAQTSSGTTILYFEPNTGVTAHSITENGTNSTGTASRFKIADVGSADSTSVQMIYTNNGDASGGTWYAGFYQDNYVGGWSRRSGSNMSSFNIETGGGSLNSSRSVCYVYGRKY